MLGVENAKINDEHEGEKEFVLNIPDKKGVEWSGQTS